MNTLNQYSISFDSRLNAVKNVLEDVAGFIKKALPNISKENINELKLIYSELLCNAVIHGNKLNNNKLVDLYIEIDGDRIFSTIKDEGMGFNYKDLFHKIDHNMPNIFDENGRGIWLVYSLSDSLSFNLPGNEIKFYKRVQMDV